MIALLLLVVTSCAGSGNAVTPVMPTIESEMTPEALSHGNPAQTYLWGYYEVFIDVENMTAEAVYDRNSMFTGNIVNFLNDIPASLEFDILEVIPETDYIDIDIDVTLMHPFPGMPQFNGYDVRGVFMGDGSGVLGYDSGLIHPVPGEDQCMLADPDDPIEGNGAPDGFTRWFNITEFANPSMPLFGYTPGKLVSPGFNGTATLCPYKYFANDLGADEDLWTYLNDHPDLHGEFTTGESNTRNYYLRFPSDKGTVFGYAILANWEGPLPEDHPSNTPESVALSVVYSGDVYYIDPGSNGGDLVFDISVWDWGVESAGVGDYDIVIESDVLLNPHWLDQDEMTPVGGTVNYSTYHVDIPADSVASLDDGDYWIIVEYPEYDYSNEYGVSNDVPGPVYLACFLSGDLTIFGDPGNLDPDCDVQVVTGMPAQDWGVVVVEFDASGSSDPDGDPLTFEWDFNNDGSFGDSYDSGTDEQPIKNFTFTNQEQVCVKLTDGNGGEAICCVDVDITVADTKNMPLRDDELAKDLAVTPEGDLVILYQDGAVWKYHLADQFQQADANFLFTAQVVPWEYEGQVCNHRIDVSPTGNMIATAPTGTGFGNDSWPAQNFDSNGNPLGSAPAPGTSGPCPDVFACKSGGSWQYSHVVLAPNDNPVNYQNNMYRKYPPLTGNSWTQNYGPGPFPSPQIGHDGIWLGYVKGAEAIDGQRWWVVKDPEDPSIEDYYAVKLNQYHYFDYEWDNAWFGTGSQTEDDDGWYSACDLTMDSEGRFYVLDKLSDDQGRIKIFEDGSPGTALTDHATGDSDTISETPITIEASDYVDPTYGNLIFVLHGDAMPSKLSIFFMAEFGF